MARLTHPEFSANARIRNAAVNSPPMRRGEQDSDAVRILQSALSAAGSGRLARSRRPGGAFDGVYGGETMRAVEIFQRMRRNSGHPCEVDGVAGEQTWAALDAVTPRPIPSSTMLVVSGSEAEVPPAETRETVETRAAPELPSAAAMAATYRTYQRGNPGYADRPGMPCHQPVMNQCAVRMSIALGVNSRNFVLTSGNARHTHSAGNSACRLAPQHRYPHNAGAQRLYDYLSTLWTFTSYRRQGALAISAAAAESAVGIGPGLIFFQDCGRVGNPDGDHIDYWDGTHAMNDLLRYNAPGEGGPGRARDSSHWFRDSRAIFFCALPD
jgi:hypothetical protein